jgi:predicted transcriptional regulator
MAKVGRPLKFKTVKELEEKIDKYFNETPIEEWTITGLALALDTYRSVLVDYEDKDEYSATVKKAKQMVEHSYEIDLKKSGRTGNIFALKNFDWKDKSEKDVTSGGEKLKGLISIE